MKKAYLHLQNGRVFEGRAFGAETGAAGELVFTTDMIGYVEALTDPCYYGQIVLFTFPLIGNYGVIPENFISDKCRMRGIVCREWCDAPSNFRSQGSLDAYLKAQNVPGICGVDTREITRIIRDCGVMPARITYSPEPVSDFSGAAAPGAVNAVAPREIMRLPSRDEKLSVALIDLGARRNIPEMLSARGASVTVYPPYATAADILGGGHDGVVISDGPGDPIDNISVTAEIKKLFGSIPILGISLGHQLLALAAGGRTEKLKYGHRGTNQPVTCSEGALTYITSQNHGYAVAPKSIASGRITYTNANDGTCEGIEYDGARAFSVQFFPESCPGPRDTSAIYDKFISMIGGGSNAD